MPGDARGCQGMRWVWGKEEDIDFIIMSLELREIDLERKLFRFTQALRGRRVDAIGAAFTDLQQLPQETRLNQGQSQSLHDRVQSIMPNDKITRYRQLKEKISANQQTILIVQRGQAVTASMECFSSNQKERDVDETHKLFLQALQSVKDFQQLGVQGESGVNFSALRQQLYMQMLWKITPAGHGMDHALDQLRKIITNNKLPLKKDEIRKIGLPQQDRRFLLNSLYRECCLSTVRIYLQGLLEQQAGLGDTNCILDEYWQQGRRSASYFFISNPSLRNLEEPGWMFEYLQHVLNANYKFFLQFVIGKGTGVRPEIASNLTRHFLGESYRCFFLPMVERRLGEDLPDLNEFLLFNFLDELGKLQDKLAASFGVRPNLIQKIILHFDSSHQILQRCLEYQQKWFQTKIFQDFINIDYSRVNLKNLDAYNIVSNFLSLIERLQHKFANLLHQGLRGRVVEFYSGQVMQVLAQVKTSFDRIYNHSRLPKIDVLLSFKRIQGDLRSALVGVLADQPKLEDALQHDYHAFLELYFQVCALEAVTPTHKKLHISLGDVMGYLCREEEHEHEKYINAFGKIYEEWAGKLQQVGKFAPYKDLKVRAIFFKYLQATNFSPVGLNLYLKIFQPYLRLIFTEDRHRAILAMITMKKEAFLEYAQSHADSLTFLNAQERKQLHSFKRTFNIE